MRVRIEGYTIITKNFKRVTIIGVQANCKTKGVRTMYGAKTHSLSHTNMSVSRGKSCSGPIDLFFFW